MKKVFALILFACVALFSGVILSSCGENNGSKTIVISDDSGLCDIRVKSINNGSERYLQDNRGAYVVSNHSNLKVEISAGDYGVDFSDLEVVVNGETLEKDVSLFDTNRKYDKYSPIPDVGTLYYGYFTIPYIEEDVTVRLLNVRRVVTNFEFEIANMDELDECEDKLKQTQINISETDEENFVTLYDFLTGEDNFFIREFDYTTEPDLNTYRTFRLKFEGISPFVFNYGCPFTLISGEEEIMLDLNDNLIRYGDEYILDLGAENIGEELSYTIKVDFSRVEYKNFDIVLPQDNQTFSIKCSATSVNMNDISQCTFSVTKNMTDAVDGILANYDNMQILANGTPLVEKEGEYVFADEIKTPNQTQTTRDWFEISVSGITYTKDGEEAEPVVLKSVSSNPSLTLSSLTTNFYGVGEEGVSQKVFGVNEEGLPIFIEGQNCVLAWEYELDSSINKYRTRYDLRDLSIRVRYAQESLFDLGQILPQDGTSLVDNVFTTTKSVQVQTSLEETETRTYTLRATYNSQTGVFDRFEMQFVCHLEENEFELVVKEYAKTVDISTDISDENTSIKCAIFNQNNEMISDNWRELNSETITLSVNALQIIAFEITVDQNDFVKPSEFTVEDTTLAAKYSDGEDYEVEGGKRAFVVKFIVSDLYYTSNATFKLIRNA